MDAHPINPADHRGLVHCYIARLQRQKAIPPQTCVDDLIAAGYLALVKAARLFDHQRGHTFSTYAYRAIMNEIQIEMNRGIKKPPFANDRVYLTGELLIEQVAVDGAENHQLQAENAEFSRFVMDLARRIASVSDTRLLQVLEGRFIDGLTLDQLGKRLDLTRERVRQIEAGLLDLLRHALQTKGLMP